MNNIIFNKRLEIEYFINNLEYLGSGSEGVCYRNNKNVYKIYNDKYKNLYNNDIVINRLLQFRNIIIDNIYFIRRLIYLDNLMIGSISEYAEGVSCSKKMLCRCNIDKLVNALFILKKNIYELSKLGICIDDNYLGNILYNGDKFKLIDTGGYFYYSDFYEMDKFDDIEIYNRNMRKIMKLLFMNITGIYLEEDNYILSFLWRINSPYKSYLVDGELLSNPDETILGIKNIISEYSDYEIKNFNDCKTLLKVRR